MCVYIYIFSKVFQQLGDNSFIPTPCQWVDSRCVDQIGTSKIRLWRTLAEKLFHQGFENEFL